MSIKGRAPVQDIAQGQAAFARDLERALRGATLDDRGWAKPDDLTLLVPLFGTTAGGGKDAYLLRLGFDHYPTWPPSAQFVNPLTLAYRLGEDAKWVPKASVGNEIAFHTNYRNKDGQLVCCSLTLEFYKVSHSVDDAVIWNGEKQSFVATIAAIKRALVPPHYAGRNA
jgi:hypothetical protein